MPEYSLHDEVVFDGRRGIVIEVMDHSRYRVFLDSNDQVIREELLKPYRAPELVPREPYRHWLWREQERLRDALANDPAVAVHNSRVEPQHHQVGVVLRALERPQPRLLLADEVGLGKTIEAGLILKELRSRNLAQRTLIIVPSSIRTQWQRELSSKFNMPFEFIDSHRIRDTEDRFPASNPWERVGNSVICTIETARRANHSERIGEANWDLVIIDEAHKARHTDAGANLAFKLLENVQDAGGLLLLTATPMQLGEIEFIKLLEILDPSVFANTAGFDELRKEIRTANRILKLARDYPRGDAQEAEYRSLLRNLDAPEAIFEAACAPEADLDLDVIDWLHTKHRLSTVMVRNRKAEVGGFQVREAHVVTVQRTPDEAALEAELQAFINEYRDLARTNAPLALLLTTFRKLLASSPAAFERSMHRRIARLRGVVTDLENIDPDDNDDSDDDSDDEYVDVTAVLDNIETRVIAIDAEIILLEDLARLASEVPDSKADALIDQLARIFQAHPDEKVLIFTQFLPTMDMLERRLASTYAVSTFSGRNSNSEKDLAIQRFRDGGQILIASEAGGEGRNLQFCHILFNYDLPWNPMRVEQRIGRLDRFGQTSPVQIFNFRVPGSMDDRVYELLAERLRVFEESVGPLEPILGDIEKIIADISLEPDAATSARWAEYGISEERRMRQARENETMMERDLIMDERSLRRDQANELLGRQPRADWTHVREFVFAYVRVVNEDDCISERGNAIAIRTPTRIAEVARTRGRVLNPEYVGTFDPSIAIKRDEIDFFALGHPFVDVLLDESRSGFGEGNSLIFSSSIQKSTFVVDYVMELTGVRPRRELVSLEITETTTARRFAPLPQPERPASNRDTFPQHMTAIQARADAEMLILEDETFARYVAENTFFIEDSKRRIDAIANFKIAYAEDRISKFEQTIRGNPQNPGIVAINKNHVRVQLEAIQTAQIEHDTRLHALIDRSAPGISHRRLGVTEIRPLSAMPGN